MRLPADTHWRVCPKRAPPLVARAWFFYFIFLLHVPPDWFEIIKEVNPDKKKCERYLRLVFLLLACYPGMLTWPPVDRFGTLRTPPVRQKAFNNKEQQCRCVAPGNMSSSGQMQTQVQRMNIKLQNKSWRVRLSRAGKNTPQAKIDKWRNDYKTTEKEKRKH